MQMQRRSMEAGSEASYCERDTWEDWGSRSSLSQVEEVATQSSGREDVVSLRAERDALARALSAERQRAATAARAHDARLAELHGVIAELVRRRAADKHAAAIPEEELSDECESTTQPAGELDNDADRSRTEQNDTSSMLSPEELPTPQEPKQDQLPDDTTDTSTQEMPLGADQPRVEVTSAPAPECDASLHLSERDSELCLSTARCCQYARGWSTAGGSCERDHGSDTPRVLPASPGRCESRQAKIASRVRLRKTDETDSNQHLSAEEAWCAEAAERLALDVCAQADLREALAAASNDDCVWRSRWLHASAECRVLRCALARSSDTARRLHHACGELEAAAVAVCAALAAADRALEAYDVLLALAETHDKHHQVSWSDTARRLHHACGELEAAAVAVCAALAAADRALEAYDVLLALAETHDKHHQVSWSDTARRLHHACGELEAAAVAVCAALAAADRALEAYDVLLALAETHDKHHQVSWSDTARRLHHACGELEAAAVAVCAALAAADRALEAYDVLLALAETHDKHHQVSWSDTARRLHHACGELEAAAVAVCAALAAADRALEAYDVLLALAETHDKHHQREAAESVAMQLLRRLDAERRSASIGAPLLSPGPWLQHDQTNGTEVLEARDSSSELDPSDAAWRSAHDARLRAHAARLKADTVALRASAHQPRLFSYHDIDEEDLPKSTGAFSMAEMEAAVMMQEMLSAREARSGSNAHAHHSHHEHSEYKSESHRSRRRRERLYRHTRASETDL